MLSVKKFSTEEQLLAIRKAWNDLLAKSPADTIFLTWEWAYSWWCAFSVPQKTLYILNVYDDGALVAIAPFVVTRLYGPLSLKRVDFLGSGPASGEYLDFIIDATYENHIIVEKIFDFLAEHKGEWDILNITDIKEDSETIKSIMIIAERFAYINKKKHVTTCPHKPLPGKLSDFLPTISKGTLKNINYQKRRLQREHNLDFKICQSHEVGLVLPFFFQLHQDRWTLKGQYGSFAMQSKRRFYKEVATKFSERGWLRLHALFLDGTLVASLYGFSYKGKYHYLQAGFDPRWSKHSVGMILLLSTLEHAISEGCMEYDFLRGTAAYKYDFGCIDRKNYSIEIASSKVKFTFYRLLPHIRRNVRALIPGTLVKNVKTLLRRTG